VSPVSATVRTSYNYHSSGDFLPSENYHMVQPVFRLYAEATANGVSLSSELFEQYYRERDGLDLTVQLPVSSGVLVVLVAVARVIGARGGK